VQLYAGNAGDGEEMKTNHDSWCLAVWETLMLVAAVLAYALALEISR